MNLVLEILHDTSASVAAIFMCYQLVTKILNMFKNFMQIFSPKFWEPVARLSYEVRASVANPVATKFWRICNATILQHWYDSRVTVLRKHANNSRLSGKKLKLNNICTFDMRHSDKPLATVIQVKRKLSYIRANVMRHSHKCLATVVRVSGIYRTTVVRYISTIRPKFIKLSHKCPFMKVVYILNHCHEIVVNKSPVVAFQ